MKRRIALICLVLVILSLTVMPGAVLAGRPEYDTFSATGIITGIENTDVGVNAFPIGDSGKWRVEDRDIGGELSGDVNGVFTLTYDGVFSIETQQGQLRGTMICGDMSFMVNGSVQPLQLVPVDSETSLPMLTITGNWQQVHKHWWSNWFGRGSQTGTFEAGFLFIPDDYGHVVQILDSSFTMTGTDFSSRW